MLKAFIQAAYLKPAVSWLAIAVAIFMIHKNGDSKSQTEMACATHDGWEWVLYMYAACMPKAPKALIVFMDAATQISWCNAVKNFNVHIDVGTKGQWGALGAHASKYFAINYEVPFLSLENASFFFRKSAFEVSCRLSLRCFLRPWCGAKQDHIQDYLA